MVITLSAKGFRSTIKWSLFVSSSVLGSFATANRTVSSPIRCKTCLPLNRLTRGWFESRERVPRRDTEHRQRERDTQRERERDIETEAEIEGQRANVSERQKNKEKERRRERDRQTEIETETERVREREIKAQGKPPCCVVCSFVSLALVNG